MPRTLKDEEAELVAEKVSEKLTRSMKAAIFRMQETKRFVGSRGVCFAFEPQPRQLLLGLRPSNRDALHSVECQKV